MPVTQTPDRLSPKKRVTEGANRGSIADLFDTSPWAAGKFWLGTHYFIPRVTVPPLGCGPAPRLEVPIERTSSRSLGSMLSG
jgi:hypothetical protein